MGYVRDRICARFGRDPLAPRPLEGLDILDAGCGGGIVCEPLARLGARVTGVDADRQAIEVARAHAEKMGLPVSYACGAVEDIEGKHFDAVLALEIVEHVADARKFTGDCAARCRKGGIAIFSTLNRTPKSFALGIVAAEHIMRWVPRGTHDWKKFIKPSELSALLRGAGMSPVDIKGLRFDPLTWDFSLSDTDINVNYFIAAEK